jgi:hypothetical protein
MIRRYLPAALLLILVSGCANYCEKLAVKVCERAGNNVSACESANGDAKTQKDCARLRSVAASCKVLQRLALEATDDEQTACHADVELLRALEKQKM